MNTPSNDDTPENAVTSFVSGDDYANLVQYGLTETVQTRFTAIREKDPELVGRRLVMREEEVNVKGSIHMEIPATDQILDVAA